MIKSFDTYLNESLLDTDPDAKKYRLVSDHFNTSVSLVSTKGENLFVAQTALGDRVCACLSRQDEMTIFESHIKRLVEESIDKLQNGPHSYSSQETFVVNVVENVDPSDEGKYGSWTAYYFYPNGTDRKYKTEFGCKGTTQCILRVENGIAKLVKSNVINFSSDSIKEILKNEVLKSLTPLDSVNYALKQVYPDWSLEEEFEYGEYKIYVPKHA